VPTSPEGSPPNVERRRDSNVTHPERATLGRRSHDYDPRTNITTKVLVGVVAIVNALYLVGETIIQNGC